MEGENRWRGGDCWGPAKRTTAKNTAPRGESPGGGRAGPPLRTLDAQEQETCA